MKYGVLGTGDVANVIATKLIQLGHEVMMGSRSASNEKVIEWVKNNGKNAKCGNFLETADFGECVFNCIKGVYAVDTLLSLKENLKGKILIDQSNPYVYKNGHISLQSEYTDTTCLGEEIQKALPETKVVKH